MNTALAVLSFAAVYGVGSALGHWVSVYYFGVWERTFGSQAGDIAVFRQVLPIFVSVATLSFLVGLSFHRTWLVHARIGPVTTGGVVSGAVASLLVFVVVALQSVEALKVVAWILGIVLFWVGPACIGAGGFRIVRRYTGAGERPAR